jgi:hypothetical protein
MKGLVAELSCPAKSAWSADGGATKTVVDNTPVTDHPWKPAGYVVVPPVSDVNVCVYGKAWATGSVCPFTLPALNCNTKNSNAKTNGNSLRRGIGLYIKSLFNCCKCGIAILTERYFYVTLIITCYGRPRAVKDKEVNIKSSSTEN